MTAAVLPFVTLAFVLGLLLAAYRLLRGPSAPDRILALDGRIAKGAVKMARRKGIKAGLIRPISVWPFPKAPFMKAAQTAKRFLVVETSEGQFVEDVKLACECKKPVDFLGKGGGWYPTQEAILEKIEQMAGQQGGVK